jgi:hypothetical protein
MTGKILLLAAAGVAALASSASSLPLSSLRSENGVDKARMVCNEYGRCWTQRRMVCDEYGRCSRGGEGRSIYRQPWHSYRFRDWDRDYDYD